MTYITHTLEEYERVIELRNTGLSLPKIYQVLSQKGFNIGYGTISDWIYTNKKPFQDKILSKIKDQNDNLTKEKAYILGTLCGDGYLKVDNVRKSYLIGLDVCDEDFADEFRKCLKEVYGILPSKRMRHSKFTNLCENPKPRHVINLSSKLAVLDLLKYSKSFKTKEWQVPKEVLNSGLDIKSAFLRGLFDSEGSASLKKTGGVYLSVCSSNLESLQLVGRMLKADFNITLNLVVVNPSFGRLKSCGYKNVKNFMDKINFNILRKKNNLELGFSKFVRKGHRTYDQEFKRQVLRMLDEGFSAPQIGKELGFPYGTVYEFVKQRNRNKINSLTTEEGIKDTE